MQRKTLGRIGAAIAAIALLVIMLTPGVYAVTVAPEKSVYFGGEVLVISGTATPNGVVTIKVFNPDGSLVYLDQANVGSDGTYSKSLFTFPTAPTSLMPFGTYTIEVYDASADETATATVEYSPVPIVSVKGVVVDRDTGDALEGVTVTLNGKTVTTDASGAFEFDNVDFGTYTVTFEKDGYITKTVEIEVSMETITVEAQQGYYDMGTVELVFDARALIEKLQKQIEEMNATFAQQLEELRSEVMETLQTKVSDLEQKVSDLESRILAIKSSIAELETKISELKGADVLLNTTIIALKGEISSLTEDVAGLQVQITKLRDALNTVANDLANAKAEIAGLKATSEALTSTLQATQQQLADLQTTVNGLQASLSVLNSNLEQLNSQLQQVANTIGTLASKSDVERIGQTVSGLSDITYAALGAGIIAVIIALAAIVMLYKKIQA